MFRRLAAAAVGAVLALSASSPSQAQIVYAPVQYQYGDGDHRYYYGGSDPAVFDMAERRACLDHVSDYAYTSDRYNHAYVHRRLIGRLDRVYSDCAPYVNARVFGYLPVDAANDANAGVPRYFRKADLVRAAVELPDGSRVVPPQAWPVRPERDEDGDRAATRPATRPRAIIIIPKKPKAQASDKLVASAAK